VSALADACHRPFSNGTEGDAWISAWCNHCARDHGLHNGGDTQPMCDLIGLSMMADQWPEGWIPEPDDGKFYLPSRMICTAFAPCEPCGGDPGAEERAERVAEVTVYWKARQ
jgi:hypothetical protein